MSALNVLLPEDPLQRLNYYNGQRLEALDFRDEQRYHMRVRRWLNKALYSAGIASGLEVTKHPTDKHAVVVGPGLALDQDGREIIVIESQVVRVCGVPRRADGVQIGNYLVIAYSEEKVAPQQDGCQVRWSEPAPSTGECCRGGARNDRADCGGDCGCGGKCGGQCAGGCGCGGASQGAASSTDSSVRERSWGAPSRIQATPSISMQAAWPTDSQRKILLGQVVLNAQCQVEDIRAGVRRYATAVKPPNATPLSLEGEKDIDKDNPKVLRFHVDGGFPDTALLYLQASKFSSLYYSEMGRHTHPLKASLADATKNFTHGHTVEASATADAGSHAHRLMLNDGNPNDGVDRENRDACKWTWDIISHEGVHHHDLGEIKVHENLWEWTHGHAFSGTIDAAGATGADARVGAALTFPNDLRVSFDGADVTAQILAQLQALDPASWATLGNGQGSHKLVTSGTGAIDLRQLGVDLGPGVHTLIFSVPAGGGQVHYNLYIS
jgi:hypothetical protein